MKKFLKKVIILFFSVAMFVAAFCVYMDPYNIFHASWIRDNGVEPNKNYIKTKYILDNPDKYDAFVFGSSRVGYIHMEGINEFHAYNMTYSEGTPHEIYDTLCVFIENEIIPKKIFVGVDSLSYTIDPEVHKTQGLSALYNMSKEDPYNFYKLYFDPAVCFEAYTTVTLQHMFDDEVVRKFYEYGWSGDYGDDKSSYDFNHLYPSIGDAYLMEETLQDIKNIVDICDEYGIKCTIFTNPMIYATYEASLEKNYYEFLRELSSITEFCNFSGYNDITTNTENWVDNSHYNASVSDMVRECFVYHAYYEGLYEQGFGQWVNKNSIESFIELLEMQRQLYLGSNN